ncbi:MAG: GNAT family N-acetyltransferase [Pseudomonadota bacterium]
MAEFENEITASLRDGTPVMIRQIHPEDKHYLTEGLKELSLASQHYRFFAPKKGFTEEELKAFTEIDHHAHDAWGAFDTSEDGPKPIGVARYIQQESDPKTADFAVTVIDSHQGKGLGTLLLGVIAARATDNGIDAFHSIDLGDNRQLFDVLDDLPLDTDYRGQGEVDVRFKLQKDPEAYPETTTGQVFREAHQLYCAACK